MTLEELKAPLSARFALELLDAGPVDAYCGWFDTEFRGSPQAPADFPVTLSTAPDPTGATHWVRDLHGTRMVHCKSSLLVQCKYEVSFWF